MKLKMYMVFLAMILASLPVLAQEKLYPVRGKSDVPQVVTADHLSFVAEKSFEYKLTVGSPGDGVPDFFPSTKARIVMLWLRIENISQQPLQVNVSKLTSVDEESRTFPLLTVDDAFSRIIAGAGEGVGDTTLISKTLRGVSLGRAGNKLTEEQIKEDMVRYSFQSGPVLARSIKEGFVYFESPQRKKFTMNVRLGDLWSKPFVFSTEKTK